MLEEVGPGGFLASEFELQETLGQISIQQVGLELSGLCYECVL